MSTQSPFFSIKLVYSLIFLLSLFFLKFIYSAFCQPLKTCIFSFPRSKRLLFVCLFVFCTIFCYFFLVLIMKIFDILNIYVFLHLSYIPSLYYLLLFFHFFLLLFQFLHFLLFFSFLRISYLNNFFLPFYLSVYLSIYLLNLPF